MERPNIDAKRDGMVYWINEQIWNGQWTGAIETWKNGIYACCKNANKTWGELGYQRSAGE